MNLYHALTVRALGSDLIIWPEAAVPQYFHNLQDYLAGIEGLANAAGSRMMFGMLRYDAPTDTVQNAVYTFGHTDTPYIKRHLVPYGEYFPVPGFVRNWLARMQLPNFDTERGAAGQPPVPLLGEQIAVTICYEDVFGAEQLHYFPAATLLVNVSNDAWFGDSLAAHQHLQIARLRAAEVRRWQLRATNTGITAVIDPYGKVTASLPQFEPGLLRASVTAMHGSTPYIWWGNWLVAVLAASVVGVGLWRARAGRG
jgi:apolipoprotein N-acyltransferase